MSMKRLWQLMLSRFAGWRQSRRRADTVTTPPAVAAATLAGAGESPLQALLATHLQLDQAIDQKLVEVVGDTESSALAIIQEVRQLYDSANTLVQYLEHSSLKAGDLNQEITESVAYLVEIGDFVQKLPAKMAHDLQSVQSVVQEITGLSELVGSVQAISMQSHLLAINAAIEGSRAGPSGAAFRVVADEMRKLAANSSAVARQISDGLGRARHAVVDGMAASLSESQQQLEEISHAATSINKLRDNFEDMSQYFKIRFTVVTKHNADLARDIAAVLGHIQYQDVVSQCIDRIRLATDQRNGLLQTALEQGTPDSARLVDLRAQMTQLIADYLAEEDKHKHSARHDAQDSGELKIELF